MRLLNIFKILAAALIAPFRRTEITPKKNKSYPSGSSFTALIGRMARNFI